MKRTNLLLALTVLLCLSAWAAGAVEDNAKKQPTTIFFRAVSPAPTGHPMAKMIVNGKTHLFALDTGAGFEMALSKTMCKQRSITVSKTKSGYLAASVKLGVNKAGEQSPPVKLPVFELHQGGALAGVVGWPFLKQFVWEMNYPKWVHGIRQSVPAEAKRDWTSFPIVDSDDGALVFEVAVGDKKVRVHLDTGAEGGVNLSPKRWSAWMKQAKPKWVTINGAISLAAGGGFTTQETAVADRFKLGKLDLGSVLVQQSFAEVLVNGKAAKVDYLIATGACFNRRVIIDGPGNRVYFGPIGKPYKKLTSINRAQATFVPKNVKADVPIAHVIKDGIAYKAGLRDGDKVLMVNGKLTSNWREDITVRPSEVFNKKPGTSVRLLVERDGKRFPLTIELGKSPLDTEPAKPDGAGADGKAQQP